MNIPEISQPTESGQSATDHRGFPAQAPARSRPSLAAIIALAAAVLAIAAGGITWLALPHGSTHPDRATATHHSVPVGYTVTGSGAAQITYTQHDGTSRTLNVRLPWQQTAALTTSSPATVSIVLGPDGGHATCTLALHGHPVQHATAYGTFGRATCTTTPRTP